MGYFVRGYRLVFGVLTLYTVGYLIARSASVINLFSYFTILSNAFAAVVLVLGAFRKVPDLLRGAATLYMAMTGLIFALLLSGIAVGMTDPWTNTVLHHIMPLVLVVDWLLVPPRPAFAVPRTLLWLVFPLAYLAYSLIRGPLVDWYPYPFLDPREHGYGYVSTMCAMIALGFVAAALLLRSVGNLMAKRSEEAVPST